jgi:hypothetical protein
LSALQQNESDRRPDERTAPAREARSAPRRSLVVGALALVSATLFGFSVAGIAQVGTKAEPSAAVVSAARDSARDNAYSRGPEWGADAILEARPEHVPCRKREKRSRVKS